MAADHAATPPRGPGQAAPAAPGAPAVSPAAASDRMRQLGADIDALTGGAWRSEPGRPEPYAPRPLAFRRIVVAVDGSEGARMAAAWAREVAVVHRAQAWVVGVVPHAVTLTYYREMWGEAALAGPDSLLTGEAEAREAVEAARADLEKSGVRVESVLLHGGAVPEVIRFARHNRADLVAVGSRRHEPLERLVLGSVADGIKDHVGASVLLAKNWPIPGEVLVPVDGSRPSKRAAALAARLCRAWRARATFLHVVARPGAADEAALRARYARTAADLGLEWVQPRAAAEVDVGEPAERIVAAAARRRAGLVVMGSRGLGGLRSLVLGSVSRRVAHLAPATVLLVKAHRAPRPPEPARDPRP